MLNFQEFETTRLKFIPVTETYAQEIFQEFTKEITIYMYPRPAKNIKETLEFIKMAQEKKAKGEELHLIILERARSEFLGVCGMHGLHTETPEFGIWLKKGAHGRKYGKEALLALKVWADQNLKYKYITYPVDKRNIPSRKLAESLGGMIEAEYQKINMAGRVLDEVEYRIYP